MILSDIDKRRELRKKFLCLRDNLGGQQKQANDSAILNNLWEVQAFANAVTVFTYVSFRSEVSTRLLLAQCLARGKTIVVPRTSPNDRELELFTITEPGKDLFPGYCGIPEPDPRQSVRANEGTIDVVLLPGSVFDEQGGRLGYGGGYYDRFLARETVRAIRIGLAYEQQVVRELPLLPHDQRVHILVTEQRIIWFHEKNMGEQKNEIRYNGKITHTTQVV